MQLYLLPFLLCLLTWSSLHVKADEEQSGDWSYSCNKNEINVKFGERLNLVSPVHRLKRCYFVSTDENIGKECCYHLKGRTKDCRDKHPKPNGQRCLKEGEYKVTNDGRGTGTCNLTIESVSEDSAGLYTSYTADDVPIQRCLVKVSGQGPIGPVFVIVLVILLSMVAGIAILVAILVHQGHIKLEYDGKLTFEWKGHKYCSIQLKKGVRERVQSMEEGTETDGEGPNQ
jgi:hypothetical protein